MRDYASSKEIFFVFSTNYFENLLRVILDHYFVVVLNHDLHLDYPDSYLTTIEIFREEEREYLAYRYERVFTELYFHYHSKALIH